MEFLDYFPNRFDFFHLGAVERQKERSSGLSDDLPFMVTFRLSGDERGVCAVAFEQRPRGLEHESMALEIANILVSKFATQLSDVTGGFVEISPPEFLDSGDRRHRLLIASLRNIETLTYNYTQNENLIGEPTKLSMRLAYLRSVQGET